MLTSLLSTSSGARIWIGALLDASGEPGAPTGSTSDLGGNAERG